MSPRHMWGRPALGTELSRPLGNQIIHPEVFLPTCPFSVQIMSEQNILDLNVYQRYLLNVPSSQPNLVSRTTETETRLPVVRQLPGEKEEVRAI